MITRRSFLASASAALASLASWRPGWAQPTTKTRITFLLVNDIYPAVAMLLDARTGNRLRTFRPELESFDRLTISPDGKTLATVGQGELMLWPLP